MSLKGKLAVLATVKAAEKVIPKGKVDDVVNAALTKIGKANGQKTSEEHIKQIKKNYLVIKAKSHSLGSMVGILAGKTPDLSDCYGRYKILDSTGAVKYKSEAEDTLTNRDILDLYDASGQKIGYVKEHLIPVGIPLLEKDVKKCSVYLGKDKIAELKKYVCFGDLSFEATEGNVTIGHQEGKRFKITYNGKLIATLHDVPLNLKDGYVDKFVMEYDDPSDEVVALLLTAAIDIIKS